MSLGTIVATFFPLFGTHSHDPIDAHDRGNGVLSIHQRSQPDPQRRRRPVSPLRMSSTCRDRHRQAIQPSRDGRPRASLKVL